MELKKPGLKNKAFSRFLFTFFITPGLYLLIGLLLFIYLFPVIWELSTSLKEPGEVFAGFNLLPAKFSLKGYITAWTQFKLAKFLVNTFFVSTAITLGTVIFCSLAGHAFGQLNFPGKNFFFFLYLSTMMVPVSVTLVPSLFIMAKFNWINSYLALIMPFIFGNAFGTFLLRQFYMTMPGDLSDSARLDGLGYLQIWWYIMLPLSKPALATLAVMTLVAQWNSFFWPLVVTHADDIKVLSVGLSDFRLLRNIQWNSLMAAVMSASLPMIAILLAAQKYFIKGIQLSGVSK